MDPVQNLYQLGHPGQDPVQQQQFIKEILDCDMPIIYKYLQPSFREFRLAVNTVFARDQAASVCIIYPHIRV